MLVVALSVVAMPVFAGLEQKVSIDFRDADIRDVLKIVADKAGVNLFINKAVRGNCSIRCSNISARDALEMVCRTNGFAWQRTDAGIIVADERLFGTQLGFHQFRNIDAGVGSRMINQLVKRDLRLASDRANGLLGYSGSPEAVREVALVANAIDKALPMVDACVQIYVGEKEVKTLWLTARLGEPAQINEKVVPASTKEHPVTHCDLKFVPEYINAAGKLVCHVDCGFSLAHGAGQTSHQLKQRVLLEADDAVLLAGYGEPNDVSVYLSVDFPKKAKK